MPRGRQARNGVVLIELTIVIPLLLFILVAVVNLASILWQIQVINEGVKYAARKAADYSTYGVSCTDLVSYTQQNFNDYATSYERSMGVQMNSAWANPVACLSSGNWDTYTYPYNQLKITVNNDAASPINCIFCALNILSYINVSIDRTFSLEWACTGSISGVSCS